METEETTVELVFGLNAGSVWRALKQSGPGTVGDLARQTGLNRESVHGALGWLGREDKIDVVKEGRKLVFSLRNDANR
jgi:hypothetical protein